MSHPFAPTEGPGPRIVVPIALAAGLLAACSLGPDYARPAVVAPTRFQEQTDVAGTRVWPAADWWTGFGSSELDRLITVAQRVNFDLLAAAARIRQARARSTVSGAALYPTLDAASSRTRRQTPSSQTGSASRQRPDPVISTIYDLQLSASYELDFWGKNRAAAEAASASEQASRYDAATVALTTVANVANGYFSVLALRERLGYAQQSLVDAEAVLAAIQARAAVGTASLIDIAPQRTIVETQRAAIATVGQQLTQQTNALGVLLAGPGDSLRIAGSTLDGLKVPRVAAGLPSELLRRRPDIANAEAQLIAANANVKSALAARFPSLTLTASGGFQSASLSSLFNPSSLLWSLAASLTAPIFQGGRLEGQERLERARFDELAATYQKSVVSAFADVETALAGIRQTADQLAAQEAATAASRTAFQATEAQYRAGVADSLNVRDAQRSYFSAQDQLAQAKLAYYQALVALFQALGGGWEEGAEAAARKADGDDGSPPPSE